MNQQRMTQQDFEARIALHKAEAARLEKILATVLPTAAIPDRPAPTRGTRDVIADHNAMAAHVAKLQELVGLHGETARQETLSRSTAGAGLPGTVPAPGAANAKPGAAALNLPEHKPSPGAKFDPDAELLAARGVKSIEELNQKGATEFSQD